MAETFTKSYRPAQFVPSTSYTGKEGELLLWGENMWIRFGRSGSIYAEGYKGSKDTGDAAISSKTLTGTITYTSSSKVVVGQAGVAIFKSELVPGQFVIGDVPGQCVLLVVEKVIDDEHFQVCAAPPYDAVNVGGKIAPVVFQVGVDRGTAIRGNVIKFIQGNYLGVGDGEFKINGASLNAAFNLSRTPRIARFDPTTGLYTQDDIGVTLPTPAPQIALAAFTPGTATIMRAGNYNIRVMAKNTKSKGYSNPSDVIAPVVLAAGDQIQVTFNNAMDSSQDAYDIYATEFQDNAAANIEKRYMGPWYYVKTVTMADLIDGGHPTGREAGTIHKFSYADAEIVAIDKLLSFNNFLPHDSLFVDLINGIPIFFSCDGDGTATKTNGTCPGPVAIPMKPSNPEGAFLDKSLSMAAGDIIIGEVQVKSRIYTMGQNTLQNIILTTLDAEPIAFRSLWNVGFRNPYALDAIKEYLYGFTNGGIVRSVAGGDDTAAEFDFASDVYDLVNSWCPGHVIVRYDPKNKAMIFFLSGYEQRDGLWTTLALPFLVDRGVFNPPIILSSPSSDFFVTGAATIGQDLVFIAGGRSADHLTFEFKTYIFDGGNNSTKEWNLCWTYTDDDLDLFNKRIKGISATGRFQDPATKVKYYPISSNAILNFSDLRTGVNNSQETVIGAIGSAANVQRKEFQSADVDPGSLYSIRIEGSYTGQTPLSVDRLDEIIVKIESNSVEN